MVSQDGGLEPRAMCLKGAIKKYHDFIRFVSLDKIHANMSFAPVVEIAWRLRKDYQGQGYATEAARAALKFAFENMVLDEVVLFTTVFLMFNIQLQVWAI